MMRKTAVLLIVILFVVLGFSSIAVASQPRTRLTYVSPKGSFPIDHENVVLKWRILSWDPIEKLSIYFGSNPFALKEIPIKPDKKGEYYLKGLSPDKEYSWWLSCRTSKQKGSWGPFVFKTK